MERVKRRADTRVMLLPEPRKWKAGQGWFVLAGGVAIEAAEGADEWAAGGLARDLMRWAGIEASVLPGRGGGAGRIVLERVARGYSDQGYGLVISSSGVRIRAVAAAGIFYGVQTLRQLVRQCVAALPCLEIHDEPDYAIRGFYHDVSRGKVPQLQTLLDLVEKLAHYKINQFQLYVEHVFAFEGHPELWAGCDPLTHEDIRRLDEHCRRHHIEFVPSLSTFGHCYRLLCTSRHEHLNELRVDSASRPFSYRDALAHYTVDCRNPETLRLMSGLIEEYAALFSSDRFNVCCDETFDLGKGRNAEVAAQVGAGRLYGEYVGKLSGVLDRCGKLPMLWADMALQYGDFLRQVPPEAMLLHWNYAPEIAPEPCAVLQGAGVPWLACAGTQGWRRWVYDYEAASLNISRFARIGRRFGACGFLNTDWGDAGHVNMLVGAYHGMILGAQCAWNVQAVPPGDFRAFDRAFSVLEWGDDKGRVMKCLRTAAKRQLVSWGEVSMWRDPSPDVPPTWRDESSGFPISILRHSVRALEKAAEGLRQAEAEWREATAGLQAADTAARPDLQISLEGARLMQEIGLALKRAGGGGLSEGALADEVRRFERRLSDAWHRRNRPSEYYRLRMDLLDAAERLDGGKGVR